MVIEKFKGQGDETVFKRLEVQK